MTVPKGPELTRNIILTSLAIAVSRSVLISAPKKVKN